jgi:GDP-4-dehydro-6-deoxy-D-mannose reductase
MPGLRILITGAGGFVGRHLTDLLLKKFDDAEICATTSRPAPASEMLRHSQLNVTDVEQVRETIAAFRPTHVVHLAALSTLAGAGADYHAAWRVNFFGALNVANAITAHAPDCTLIFVGSGQVYGGSARQGTPIDEGFLLEPLNEYAVTKAAADLAIGAVVASRGLKAVRMRPFNHIGPGQSPGFAVPDFAQQIVNIEAGLQPPVIKVGNLDAERDFLDVRDVARAYTSAIAMSDRLPAGLVLNIASGTPIPIHALLGKLLALSKCSIRIEQDASRMRTSDIPRYVGNASRARDLLNWSPQYPLDETLADALRYFRANAISGLRQV